MAKTGQKYWAIIRNMKIQDTLMTTREARSKYKHFRTEYKKSKKLIGQMVKRDAPIEEIQKQVDRYNILIGQQRKREGYTIKVDTDFLSGES